MKSEAFPRLRELRETALGFLYPEVCQHCGEHRATKEEGYVCSDCWRHLRFIRPPFCDRCGVPFEGDITTRFDCANCREMDLHFAHARSAVAASGLALDLIHRFKYRRELWLEPFLSGLLIRESGPVLREGKWDLIVPVPLHPLKLAEREFNQAERLGRSLGAALGIEHSAALLLRVEATRTQTLLSRAERADNVRRAFARAPGAACRGRRVVVVDDVFTTGATTSACARVLLACGAAEVCVWTVARGLLHS